MTHAHLDALRDQLAAVIRDQAPLPISTDQVAELATGKPHGWTIYRHLRILENRGLIGRLRIPNDTRAFWHWIAVQCDHDWEHDHVDANGHEHQTCASCDARQLLVVLNINIPDSLMPDQPATEKENP